MTPTALSLVPDVEARISSTLELTIRAIAPAGASGRHLTSTVTRMSQAGKRLRAQLLLAVHTVDSGPYADAAISLASALELFQTAALIHDDVIDDSPTRRAMPAAHRRLATLQQELGWRGPHHHSGVAGAILAGDLALMAAFRCLGDAVAVLPATSARRAHHLFADMAELVTAGQYLDMALAAAPIEHLEQQHAQIDATMRSKTASYSAQFPCAMGAAIAGGDDARVERWAQIGIPVGVAFQIRDDVLGLVGQPEVTGKPVGDDIREGKRTVLVAHAWTYGDGAVRAALAAAMGNPNAPAETLAHAIEAIRHTGAFEAAEKTIASLLDQGLEGLRALCPPSESRDHIEQIFTSAATRRS